MLPIRCLDCNLEKKNKRVVPFPDWVELDDCEPFFDEYTCKYYIAITLPYTEIVNEQMSKYKKEAIESGVEKLLEFYESTEEYEKCKITFDQIKIYKTPI